MYRKAVFHEAREHSVALEIRLRVHMIKSLGRQREMR